MLLRCVVTKIITQREPRNDNAKVIEAVTADETLVVTRNGEPVAQLSPVHSGRRSFIARADVAALAGPAVRIDPRETARTREGSSSC